MTFTPLVLAQRRATARRRATGSAALRWIPLASALVFAAPGASHAAEGWPQGRIIDAGPVHHVAPAPVQDAGADQVRAIREPTEPKRPTAPPPPRVSSCGFAALGVDSKLSADSASWWLLAVGLLWLGRRCNAPAQPSAGGHQAT